MKMYSSTDHYINSKSPRELSLTNRQVHALATTGEDLTCLTWDTWLMEWKTVPWNQPWTDPVWSEANCWSQTPDMSEAKAWEFHLTNYKKSTAQHKVYMHSMWFSFQTFGLCMPLSQNSVKCNYIKTRPCHQNIPLKTRQDIKWHEILLFSPLTKRRIS